MVDRFYSINFAEDVESATGGTGSNITSGAATSGKDIEVRINVGAGTIGDARYDFYRQNRAIVIEKLKQITDELESGKLNFPQL